MLRLAALLLLHTVAWAQKAGSWYPEVHPRLTTWSCTKAGGCQPHNTSVVLDGVYRYMHTPESSHACMDVHGKLVPTYCADAELCANNCVMEGANYTDSGVETFNDGDRSSILKLNLYVKKIHKHPRVYLISEDDQNYEIFRLRGQEFTFETDVSKVPCTQCAALYFVAMPPDGGRNQYNPTGAAMGNGYCDGLRPLRSLINGTANIENLRASCSEIDLWEANVWLTSMGYLPCQVMGSVACENSKCLANGPGQIWCCNTQCHYRTSDQNPTIYGHGKAVDVTKPMTVVTQFLTNANSDLVTVKRLYVQNGVLIETANGAPMVLNDDMCAGTDQVKMGGMKHMGDALQYGMVLTISLFSLDWFHNLPPNVPCLAGQGVNSTTTFSNIRYGEIGSTYSLSGKW